MRVLAICLIVALLPFPGRTQVSVTENTITASAQISAETLQDFVYLLEKSTGNKWNLQKSDHTPRRGIYLGLYDDKAFKTKESFRLQSNGKDFLSITSSSVEGLVFGFYKHFRQLRFRFYLPGEDYTVIPKLSNPFGVRQDLVDKPFLQIRDFFGTGGFGSGNSDPEKSVATDWNRWKLRNGFGSAYSLGGHRGENFILENKEVLKKNPQWLVTPLKGQPSDLGIKLNYLDKQAVDSYTSWTIQPFTRPAFVLPPANHTQFVSIEPSDGGGYLNDIHPDQTLPSISDQVYSAANVAAEKLDTLFPHHPNIGVNLYAYSSHAAPPSFPLNPRVFVQLVPYQFQNIAFGPSFVKLWASKVKRFGLYDYYNYTDSQYDLPGGITLEEVMKRLVHSVRNGSEGTHFETSYSKFATGIPLWVVGRYMADGDGDWEKNLAALTRELYKEAAPKVSALFQLFYNQPAFGPQYMGNAVKLLSEADAIAKKPAVKERLNELKQYLQFADLVYQSRDPQKGKTYERLLPVAEYAWKLYPQKIVSSYRIMQLVSYAFLNTPKSDKDYALYQKLHKDWFPETKRNISAWNKIPQSMSVEQVQQSFAALKNKYTVVSPVLAYDLKKIYPLTTSGFVPRKTMIIGGSSAVRGYFGVYTPTTTSLKITYKIEGSQPSLTISSIDQDYVHDTAIVLKKASGTIVLPIAAGETTVFLNAAKGCTYRVRSEITNGLYFFDGSPRGKMAFYRDFKAPYNSYTYDPMYYPSYLYLPEKTRSVDYKVQLNHLRFTGPTGRRVSSQLISTEHGGFEYRKFDVAPGEDGRIWQARISGNFNYSLLNVPDRYLLLQKE